MAFQPHTPGLVPLPVRRTGRLVLAAVLCAYLATTGGSFATDVMTYEVTKGMVEHGSVAMSYNVHDMEAHRGVDGRYYAPYGIGHALYGMPFYVAGRVAESSLGLSIGRADAIRKAAFVCGSAVAAALTVWIVFLFAWRLGADRRAAVWTALTVAFGTLLWPYAKFGFNAPLATLAVVGGVYGVWTGVRYARPGALWAGSLLLAFALLVRHELAIVTVVAAFWAFGELGRQVRPAARAWIALGLPSLAAGMLTLYYNQVRFGSPWDTGYLRDGTATFGSAVDGIAGLVISPGRSVFLYTIVALPAVVALVRMVRRDRSTAWLLSGVSAALFVFYASLTYWDADRSYGPRYLLPMLPLVCVPLVFWFGMARGLARSALLTVVAASVIGQLPGVLVDFTKVGAVLDLRRIEIEQRRWNWELAGLVLNTRAALAAVPLNVRYVTGAAEPPATRPPDGRAPEYSEQFGYSLDFWWLYLYYMRVLPAPLALGAGALLLGASVWMLVLLGRTPRQA
jgi:hypothetical protein